LQTAEQIQLQHQQQVARLMELELPLRLQRQVQQVKY
jgi:hypothetical protein